MSPYISHDIFDFFLNLLIISAVAVPFLLIVVLVEKADQSTALLPIFDVPEYYRQILRDKNFYFKGVPVSVRWTYCVKSFLYALCICAFFIIFPTIYFFIQGDFSVLDWLIPCSPIFVIVLLLALKDCFRVGPWHKIYRTTAYLSDPCRIDKRMRYVVFYDYFNKDFSIGRIHVYELFLANIDRNQDVVDIIIYETPKKLKVIGVYQDTLFSQK